MECGGAAAKRPTEMGPDLIEGQPRDRAYTRQGSYMGQGGQGFYGSPTASRSQTNPAVMGAMMIGLWALQRYQERHQRHHQHYAMRNYRGSRHSRGFNSGNPM